MPEYQWRIVTENVQDTSNTMLWPEAAERTHVRCAYTSSRCLRRDADGNVPYRDTHGQIQVELCDACNEWFCLVHNHVRRYRCSDCTERFPLCQPLARCDDCGDRFCESCWDGHDGSHGDGDDEEYYGSYREAALSFEGDHPIPGRAEGARYMSVELEAEHLSSGHLELPDKFGIAGDGSLNNGIEVTLPPSRMDALDENVRIATDALVEAGYGILPSCGMHAHIDLRDKRDDPVFLSHLHAAFYAVEDILFAMQYRRHENAYCTPLRREFAFYDTFGARAADYDFTFYKLAKTPRNLRHMADMKRNHGGPRYRSMNFHSVYYRGSLEVRLHEGTLDPARIMPWLELLQRIVAKVEHSFDYRWVTRLASLDVTEEKLRLFRRIFKLPDWVWNSVRHRIESNDHMGFRLPFSWGQAKRGRAARLAQIPRRFQATMRRCRWCSGVIDLGMPCPYDGHAPVLPPRLDENGLADLPLMQVEGDFMSERDFHAEFGY